MNRSMLQTDFPKEGLQTLLPHPPEAGRAYIVHQSTALLLQQQMGRLSKVRINVPHFPSSPM